MSISRIFGAGIIITGLGAIVYLGGNFLTTGEFIPSNKVAIQIEPEASTPAKIEIAKVTPIEIFIPNPAKGKKVSGKCKACHTFNNGGRNSTGPNLWGIVGKLASSTANFSYSSALQAKSDMTWTEENLNEYLTKPSKFIPGNKMAFGGIKKQQNRENLIEWLKTLK